MTPEKVEGVEQGGKETDADNTVQRERTEGGGDGLSHRTLAGGERDSNTEKE